MDVVVVSNSKSKESQNNSDENCKIVRTNQLSNRKSLKIVQQSANDDNILVGNDRPVHETSQKKRKIKHLSPTKRRKIHSLTSGINIYEDDSTETNSLHDQEELVTVHRDSTDPSHLLTSEEPSLDYWKMLAETRRVALESALKENEQLHNEVNRLTSRVEELVDENKTYIELAERAEQLADTLKYLTDENELPSGDNSASQV